jgi:AraC family transcriptional regulator, regulatory protein of adaptative response / DNA-3-methyladenine glycosylase II
MLDRGADRAQVRASLLALPGIGSWTADYVAMRALGDPDIWLGTDLGLVRTLRTLGRHSGIDVAELESIRPWRSYAVMHLWNHAVQANTESGRQIPSASRDMVSATSEQQ